ncbi:MAG: hypothetical protein ABW252_02770 [Polyangiales bacterium]
MDPFESSARHVALRTLAVLGLATTFGCGSGATQSGGEAADEPRRTRDAGAQQADARTPGSRPSSPSDTPSGVPDETLEMLAIDDCGASNPAGLDAAKIALLEQGGSTDGMRYLYPYDGTVFPRGLAAPMLMWEGPPAEAVLVRIRAKFFRYDGCLVPRNGRVVLPKEVWDKAGAQTLGPSTPFTVELSTLAQGAARGPIREELVIARARVQGSIYYNSYNSGALGAVTDVLTSGPAALDLPPGGGTLVDLAGSATAGGSISRIRAGSDRPETFLRFGVCTGCHSVSANGERMLAKEIASVNDGQVYTLKPDSPANPAPTRASLGTAFAGLTPDGSAFVTTAGMPYLGPPTLGSLPSPPSVSQLFETDSGKLIENSGVPSNAMMPTFSPGGTLLSFAAFAQNLETRITLMRYDPRARKADEPRDLYRSPSGSYAGWPFVLPDDRGVIFTLGSSPRYAGDGAGILPILRGPHTDLMIVDVASGKATMLAKAMGFATPEDADANRTYLPFGAAELHQSYYPTVSPVASGGYFWVFFDSVRHYGNLGLRRQLWGTAVRIPQSGGEFGDAGYEDDPSHPAFYVTGQQLQTANHRAFTALDPCREMGASCETGVDCCSGFCTDGVCSPPRDCANSGEACGEADCCNEDDQCIAGYCGVTII